MNARTGIAVITASIGALLMLPAQAQEGRGEGWSGEITPYFWGLGVDGDATVGGRDVELDVGFDDILDEADAGGSILGRLQFDRWLVYGQVDYLDLSFDREISVPNTTLETEFETESTISTLAGGYDFGEGNSGVAVLVGVREFDLDNDLTVGAQRLSDDRNITDTIVMAIPRAPLWEHWQFSVPIAYGEGDSESTWEVWPQVRYEFSGNWDAGVGYRYLEYDIEGDAENKFDAAFQGVTLSLSYRW